MLVIAQCRNQRWSGLGGVGGGGQRDLGGRARSVAKVQGLKSDTQNSQVKVGKSGSCREEGMNRVVSGRCRYVSNN